MLFARAATCHMLPNMYSQATTIAIWLPLSTSLLHKRFCFCVCVSVCLSLSLHVLQSLFCLVLCNQREQREKKQHWKAVFELSIGRQWFIFSVIELFKLVTLNATTDWLCHWFYQTYVCASEPHALTRTDQLGELAGRTHVQIDEHTHILPITITLAVIVAQLNYECARKRAFFLLETTNRVNEY